MVSIIHLFLKSGTIFYSIFPFLSSKPSSQCIVEITVSGKINVLYHFFNIKKVIIQAPIHSLTCLYS